MYARKTKGSAEGAFYQDTTTGIKYLVKFGSDDAIRNEVLASKLYQLAGHEAPELFAINLGGRPAVASRLIDNVKEVDARTLASTASVTDGFAADAWLANWDVIGLDYDNTVLAGGRAIRIDVGGALRYRAQGGLKGRAFGNDVNEIESLRDASLNRTSFEVFKNLTQDQIEAGVVRILRISDNDIRATVARYGPADLADREALADTLIARRNYLARRYPAAAAKARAADEALTQPAPATARVTATEQQFIDDARVNGYGLATDGDQIEDHMVLVSNYTKANDSKATRGFFKLREDAGARLKALADANTENGVNPSVDFADAKNKILAVVKSINFRVDKSNPYDSTVLEKANAAIKAIDKSLRDVDVIKATAVQPDELAASIAYLKQWRSILSDRLPDIEKLGPAVKVQAFDADQIMQRADFRIESKAKKAAITWQRNTRGGFDYEEMTVSKSFAKETGRTANAENASGFYTARLEDGTVIRFFPHTESVPFAMRGLVQIDVAGAGITSTSKIFDIIEQLGIDSKRASLLDRQHLYLNAFARLRLIRSEGYSKQYEAITGNDQAALDAKLAIVKKAAGVDVAKSEGWRQIDGVRQAFGHGRAYQLRPDLDTPEFDKFAQTHSVFHNPTGLSLSASSNMVDKFKAIIEGGGTMASQVDRIRRGIRIGGTSATQDLDSGGGDYVFTRIVRTQSAGSGFYWKPKVLKRMDAITYGSDQYGRTTPDHLVRNRLGQEVKSFETVANKSGNETIFKGGLSVFDDLDRIVVPTETSARELRAWMKANGYTKWPDGRNLEEVIISSGKHGGRS